MISDENEKMKRCTYKHILLAALLLISSLANADYSQRFSLGAGAAVFNNSSSVFFELGGEYEYRVSSFLGLGGFASYIFSSPGLTEIGLPEVFLHPFGNQFFFSASPIIEFGSGMSTQGGVRLGTRLPIPLGAFTVVPSFAVDFINSSRVYIIGLGFEF